MQQDTARIDGVAAALHRHRGGGSPFTDLPSSVKVRMRQEVGDFFAALESLGLRVEGALQSGTHPAHALLQAEESIRSGEPLLAYDALSRFLDIEPLDVRARQLMALALARCGAWRRARAVTEELLREGHADEECLGLLARVAKGLALRSADPTKRTFFLEEARSLYADAHRRTGGLWTGINAASLAFLLGRPDQATDLGALQEDALEDLAQRERTGEDCYWTLATLGEAAVLRREWAAAEAFYRRAAHAGQGRWGDLGSTRRNLRLLLESAGEGAARLDEFFPLPGVAVFAGHMVDRPGRGSPRFRPEDEGAAARAIRRVLDELDIRVGFSSAACGGDLLFLEALLERGGEAHVVLPHGPEAFAPDCVAFQPGWAERFHRVLARARECVVASERREASAAHYLYSMELMHGLAAMRADQVDSRLVGVALWDGQPGDGPGGTADLVARCLRRGDRVEVIRPGGRRAPPPGHLEPIPMRDRHLRPMAILFADAQGFSRLEDEQVPRFVAHFLGAVAEVAEVYAPEVRNSWGDGLYFLLDDVIQAGRFALDLQDRVNATDWLALGLPGHMALRMALHVGPLRRCHDPVTRTVNYTGRHVSRAARIEPVAPPGEVYSSREFAALCASRGAPDLDAEYVGQMGLAKGYGVFPTYHLQRRLG